ncbi:interleukin-7 receptor subunit alpha isoform 2-T3 [Polymixia lowei]
MLFSFWIPLLLVPGMTEAQSGDGEMDIEPRIICTSHISKKDGNSLTCNLAVGNNDSEDDEDDEGDDIESMTVCCCRRTKAQCVEGTGNTITSKDIHPITTTFNVTITLKRGGKINRTFDLRNIVKPKSPQVWNATFQPQSNKAVIHIRNPYQEDYIKPGNLLFQLHIWSVGTTLIDNITTESMIIEGEFLQRNTYYHVKVRAIPYVYFKGTWSEWSSTVDFSTNTVKAKAERQVLLYNVTVSLITLLLVTSSVVIFWRKKICTYMWPSIPHPKHTLMQIYHPIKGLPVSFNPEVFSDLNIYPVEKIEKQRCAEAEPVSADHIAKLKDCCCSQVSTGETLGSSSSNTSINTEESLSTLLSRSSTEEEEYPPDRSRCPSIAGVLQPGDGQDTPPPEHSAGNSDPEMYGVTRQGRDEAYVTMSSFYQIK